MKHIFSLGFAAVLGLLVTSCEKCSTCSTLSTDPQTSGEILTEEVCGQGRKYEDHVTIYTRAGWECTDVQ